MSKQSSDLFAEIQETAQSLFETQKWDEAVYSTQVALDNARDLLDGSQTSLKHLINCLELHSRSLRMKGESEESRQEIREALRVVKELDRDQIDHEQYARIETGHAVLSDQLGNIEDATKSYKLGIESYERLDEYPVTEISDLLNNLAYLYKYQDLTDEAENTFKKALVILEKESNGKETERTALVKNNLGALYQQVEDFDLAEQMFKKALDARKEVLGDDHPDTGQTHGNLAIALASKGNQEDAIEHFDDALKIYGGVVDQYAEDFEIIADNYIDYLDLLERKEDLEKIQKLKNEKLA